MRESVYLYTAACPTDGTADSLIMPTMHTQCFQHLVDYVAEQHPDQLNLMVVDGAASHTSSGLTLPDNVRIITLPPYSPELNPVEQIWDLIRERHFANHVFDSLDDVEAALARALQQFDEAPIQLQTLMNRSWIQTACLD